MVIYVRHWSRRLRAYSSLIRSGGGGCRVCVTSVCNGIQAKNSAFIPSCFYASRLQPGPGAPTVEVSLVCRSNYRAIAERGVILRTRSFGDYTFTPKHVFPSVSDASKHQHAWDYIVVTTKALPDVSDDSEVIQPLVTIRKSAIVLIQNGVRPQYELS
jgi:ketopantoate reductase